MPNQEMLDRMPEVSQNTVEKTLAGQIEGLQQKMVHQHCERRIADLEIENKRLRALVGED